MMDLRLLLVGPYPPPYGGIASHLTNLIPGLRRRGVAEIAVVSFGTKDAAEEVEGAVVYRVNAKANVMRTATRDFAAYLNAFRVLGDWRLGPRKLLAESVRTAVIAAVARERQSNVVAFYQADESLAMLPLKRMWNDRIGIVLTVFGEVYDSPEFFETKRAQVDRLLGAADTRLSSSLHCARSFGKIGVNHSIEAIYYGVELERFECEEKRQPFRQQHGFDADDFVVLYLGRFTADMGVDSVLDVIPRLLRDDASMRFVLAGAKGPFTAAADEVARRYPSQVVILNDVPFALLPSLYAGCDVVLAPTRDQHACMGMSIKEAMAASRAVIGSDAGGIPEAIVEGETGYLVPLGADRSIDRALLAARIKSVAESSERRIAMGRAGRTRAEELFSNDKTVDRILAVFKSVQPS